MTSYVHGGTDEREVARLEKQAGFTASLTLRHFDVAPGMRVLDLATGVGAMAAQLVRRFPGARVVGLDLSAAQLSAARRNHPEIPVLRGDATRLPFADGTFDRVHWSWLLEHVPAPVPVLREVRRVLKPGGLCQFIEVDNATFGTTPRFAQVEAVMQALNRAQRNAGGDPLVGQVLHRYLSIAGFRRFTKQPVPLRGSAEHPEFFSAFIDEFAEIFEGLDESLGPDMAPVITTAAAQLRSLRTIPGAQMRYTGVLVHAWK